MHSTSYSKKIAQSVRHNKIKGFLNPFLIPLILYAKPQSGLIEMVVLCLMRGEDKMMEMFILQL
jgi:hypothetical protein